MWLGPREPWVPGVSSCRSRPSSSASSRGSYLMSCTLDSRMSISSFKSCTAAKKHLQTAPFDVGSKGQEQP